MKDFKYLIAYLLPASAFLALEWRGYWLFFTVIFAFGLLPLGELFLPQRADNTPETDETTRSKTRLFDWLLYLHLPLLYLLIINALYVFKNFNLSIFETIGMVMSVGIIVGSFGINVAHELGHRSNPTEQFISKLLLLPALYMHFFIEHNLGHHKNVATDADPASARIGENMYAFWFRSVKGSYISAWQLEAERLKKLGKPTYSIDNQMIWFQIIQLIYLVLIGIFFGYASILMAIGFAVTGFLLLESVNYIEHYGLRRQKLGSGRYEPVLPKHSWNSNHELGRIFLYELTRHSDHHYKSTRKYQVLRHYEAAPQLPFGYPMSILIAFLPPIWFKMMNKRLGKN
jgi:alkane 1-monooxygenase